MLYVEWNTKRLVYFKRALLNPGQTATTGVCAKELGRLDQGLRVQGVEKSTVKFLHDDAGPHVAKSSQQKIKALGWELLPHPSFSPDLAPSALPHRSNSPDMASSDYPLFRSIQLSLAEKKFNTGEEFKHG